MDTINAVIETLLRPFVAWILLAAIIGQVVKTQVFTRTRAHNPKIKARWFWWWGRKTLALQPALTGVAIGVLWPGTVEAGYEGGTIQAALYFGLAGGLSVWGFEVLKGLAKKKGIILGDLPGASTPPDEDRTPTDPPTVNP